jgi:hypothetical protein
MSSTPLMDRMARRGTTAGGQASYSQQSLHQRGLDIKTVSSMKSQLHKIYSSVYAWWKLSSDQKKVLDQKRDQGMFGGTPGKAPYMWIQEGTMNPQGATRAGIKPTAFIENALAGCENSVADAIMGALSAG